MKQRATNRTKRETTIGELEEGTLRSPERHRRFYPQVFERVIAGSHRSFGLIVSAKVQLLACATRPWATGYHHPQREAERDAKERA